MPPSAVDLRVLAPSARLSAQADASAALGNGKVVIASGDTGYLACAAAATPAGLDLALAAGQGAEGGGHGAVRVGINPGRVRADGAPTAGGARRRPTVVAIERSGNVRVVGEGAYEARYVMKHAALNVLLVCTGNTCRSPMAEAIG